MANISDLTAVVYSSGKVFDGLSTGRLDTEDFLRSGSLAGVTSRHDLSLLEDLRDASEFIIQNQDQKITPDYVRDVNRRLTRSASMHPGEYRHADSSIGVRTDFGDHEPPAVDDAETQQIIRAAMHATTPEQQALDLFVALAKAQPFEDGNKRTALFVANSVLIRQNPPKMLAVPYDDDDSGVAKRFNSLLGRAYIFNEFDGVQQMMRELGLDRLGVHRGRQRRRQIRRLGPEGVSLGELIEQENTADER